MPTVHPIAHRRKELGLTQSAFGELFGVDGMTIYRWEQGMSLPRRKFWPKLEELTGQPIAAVIAAARPVTEAAE